MEKQKKNTHWQTGHTLLRTLFTQLENKCKNVSWASKCWPLVSGKIIGFGCILNYKWSKRAHAPAEGSPISPRVLLPGTSAVHVQEEEQHLRSPPATFCSCSLPCTVPRKTTAANNTILIHRFNCLSCQLIYKMHKWFPQSNPEQVFRAG